MYQHLLKFILLGAICALYLPTQAYSAPFDQDTWTNWFNQQIQHHPHIIAEKEKMQVTLALIEGQQQPLYNPELETELEREGKANNYLIGINQTIDWWDKRQIYINQAPSSQVIAQQELRLVIQEKIATALQTLVQWHAAKQLAKLAQEQEKQLDTLTTLVADRQKAGDLGQVDAELTFLRLSQKLNETAQAKAQLKEVEIRVNELLPDWSTQKSFIPAFFWSVIPTENNQQELEQHPKIAIAKANWRVLEHSTTLARLEAKSDPNLGINVGKNDGDNTIALNLSIPLPVRNTYRSEIRAAKQNVLSAKANYLKIKRKQQFMIKASQAIRQEYQKRFARWQTLMQGRSERITQLLKQQWQSGDMSTTEYLLALQQHTEGLIAGIELQKQYQLAHIDWLLQAGHIDTALLTQQ